jgi:hypothetical protein
MHSMSIDNMTEIEIAMTLAARASCDRRTAVRALRKGAGAIRTIVVRERLARALGELGIVRATPTAAKRR